MILRNSAVVGSIVASAVLFVACAGAENAGGNGSGVRGNAAPTGTGLTPDPGRSVVEVDMLTDEYGENVFIPADFDVRQGDVIRFVLRTGVHNAHFLPDSSLGVRGLPPMGPLLQLPGQTWDVKVTWEEGRHFYQCDPHALIGMVGHVTVRSGD